MEEIRLEVEEGSPYIGGVQNPTVTPIFSSPTGTTGGQRYYRWPSLKEDKAKSTALDWPHR